jgi:hypothetical protein
MKGKIIKSLFLISIYLLFAMTSEALCAQDIAAPQEKAPLGKGNFALKLAYINFTDDHFDERGSSDSGVYFGLEGYGRIMPNFYLGGEIGRAFNVDLLGGEEIDFIPIELNLKYAIEAARNFVVDLGVGVSYSYVEIQYDPFLGPKEEKRDDWLLGGQVFTDLTYKIGWFAIGVDAKYQMTEDFKEENVDLSNWRLGIHIGGVF